MLQDDKHLYPSYMSGNVVRSEVLIAHPELRPVLESLNHTITRSRDGEDEITPLKRNINCQLM